MRNLGWLVVVGVLCVSHTARSADTTADERIALDRALMLAGLQTVHLPIGLTPEPLAKSPAAEAWTIYGEDGKGTQILVYTGSRIFRCAAVPIRPNYQCVLRLASIIVHEAWHVKNGPDEAGAYQAQLSFLQFNDASGAETDAVRRARDFVLAGKRNRSTTVSTRCGPQPACG